VTEGSSPPLDPVKRAYFRYNVLSRDDVTNLNSGCALSNKSSKSLPTLMPSVVQKGTAKLCNAHVELDSRITFGCPIFCTIDHPGVDRMGIPRATLGWTNASYPLDFLEARATGATQVPGMGSGWGIDEQEVHHAAHTDLHAHKYMPEIDDAPHMS